MATVLFWWNPLLHWACDEISELREEICDNYVVLVQGEGQRLARILVDLAARVTAGPLLPSTIGVLEPRLAGLTGRVVRLLNMERDMETRMNLRSKVLVFACGLVVLIAMATVGGLRLAHAEPAAKTKPAVADQTADRANTTVNTGALLGASLGAMIGELEKKFAATPSPAADLWKNVVERLGHRLKLRGQVVDPDGKPRAGARVYLLENPVETYYASPEQLLSAKVCAVSGIDGNFDFTMEGSEFIVPSRYGCIILAMADGFAPGVQRASYFEPGGILKSFEEDVNGPQPHELKGPAVVRLAKDDVPLTGRIVDAQGRPVADANIRVLEILATLSGNLTLWRNAVEKEKLDFPAQFSYLGEHIPVHRFPQLMAARTDADGKFRLKGIGRERVAELLVEGPTIESAMIYARTEPGATVVVPDRLGPHDIRNRKWNFYGADFQYVANPSIPIVGTVKDKDTGRPLAGVTICGRSYGWEPGLRMDQFVCAATDAQGRYHLTGAPIGKQCHLVARPSLDQPYLCAAKSPNVRAKTSPCQVDFQLKRGIWIRGRVTDEKTGRPLQAGVRYFVFRNNPHAKSAPHFQGATPLYGNYWTDRDGSYAVPGLPGRGIVAINVCGYEHFCYPSRLGAAKISGERTSNPASGGTGTTYYDTAPIMCMPDSETVMTEVNIAENAASIRQDFKLASASRLVGVALDPKGKPVTSGHYSGFSPTSDWVYWPTNEGKFTISAYSPDQPRTVLLVDLKQKLAGSLILEGPQTESGEREIAALGGDHRPGRQQKRQTAGWRRDRAYQWKKPSDPHEGYLPDSIHETMPGGYGYPTDHDGRFHIEGLAPGIKYSAWVWDQKVDLIGELLSGVTVESGQTKDLGDLKLKPFERPARKNR